MDCTSHHPESYRPARQAQARGFGFDDAGERVPVTEFNYPNDDATHVEAGDSVTMTNAELENVIKQAKREGARSVVHMLTDGLHGEPKEAGRRAFMFLHEISQDGTLTTLADSMGVTKARACQLFQEFKNLTPKKL